MTVPLMLIEDNNVISEESVLANSMNQYFISITKQMNLKKSAQSKNLEDITNQYHNHISIEKVLKQHTVLIIFFSFSFI